MEPTTVPIGRICELTGLTQRHVQRLAKEGVIPKAKRGEYPLDESIQGYIKYLQDKVSHRDTAAIQREIKEEELRALREKNDVTLGQAVPLEEIDRLIIAVSSRFATAVDALGPQYEAELEGAESRKEIRQILDRASTQIRKDTADELVRCTEGTPKARRRRRQAAA